MTQTWFTSDLHLGHRLVAGLRGFSDDVAAHDRWIAQSWDERVKHDDRVFVLGDVAMNFKPETAEWFRQRPGVKHLLSGNHDAVHPMHSKYFNALPKFLEVFATVQPFLRIKVQGHPVFLSHFPYTGEGGRDMEDRHTQWRLRDEGHPLLHGHTHSPTVHEAPYSFHVGLDAHDLGLVHENKIVEWVSAL